MGKPAFWNGVMSRPWLRIERGDPSSREVREILEGAWRRKAQRSELLSDHGPLLKPLLTAKDIFIRRVTDAPIPEQDLIHLPAAWERLDDPGIQRVVESLQQRPEVENARTRPGEDSLLPARDRMRDHWALWHGAEEEASASDPKEPGLCLLSSTLRTPNVHAILMVPQWTMIDQNLVIYRAWSEPVKAYRNAMDWSPTDAMTFLCGVLESEAHLVWRRTDGRNSPPSRLDSGRKPSSAVFRKRYSQYYGAGERQRFPVPKPRPAEAQAVLEATRHYLVLRDAYAAENDGLYDAYRATVEAWLRQHRSAWEAHELELFGVERKRERHGRSALKQIGGTTPALNELVGAFQALNLAVRKLYGLGEARSPGHLLDELAALVR